MIRILEIDFQFCCPYCLDLMKMGVPSIATPILVIYLILRRSFHLVTNLSTVYDQDIVFKGQKLVSLINRVCKH